MVYMQSSNGTVIETDNPELWEGWTRLSKAKGQAAMEQEARSKLLEMLKPGNTVWTVLRHVSSSGMCRHISVVAQTDTGPFEISGWVAQLLGYRRNDRNGGLVVGGCGMDMGFHVVYNLSRVLFRDWQCIGKGCPSNDHSNGDKNYKPHKHSDGGYALNQKWL